MNLNSHPHPYAVFIGGNGMGTSSQTELYCAAVGNGKFIVRGFGPEPFRMTGLLSESNATIHKAAGRGQPVTQDISLSVKGDKVVCSINGSIVANYDKGTLECAIPPGSSAIRKLELGVRVGLFQELRHKCRFFQEQWHAFSSILATRAGNPWKSIDPFSLTLATYIVQHPAEQAAQSSSVG